MVGSQRAYARHRGVTHRAVQVAISSSRISTLPGGRVDFEIADREWRENTDAMLRPPGPNDSPELRRARVQWLAVRTARAKLDYDRERARYAPAEDAERERAQLARKVTARLLEVPGAVAQRRREARDIADMHRLIEGEITRALWDLTGPAPDPDA